jgi:hypothetical protein
MFIGASFLQKVFDKGIDITASIIANLASAVVVALTGLALWKWNKRRELKADRQE